MNISTKINSKKNIRVHSVTGHIDTEELIKYLKKLYNSDDINPAMNVLWDLREADFSKVSTLGVREVMEFVSKNWGTADKSKAALIVSKELDYGLSRMYQLLMDNTSSSTISIFKDKDEAEVWLES